MFYMYRQNNSGGKFVINNLVGQFVIIEANSIRESDRLAKEKAEIYFNGCEEGYDCFCCGDRWDHQYGNGTEEPMIYDKNIEQFRDNPCYGISDTIYVHIYYKNGEHIEIVCKAK